MTANRLFVYGTLRERGRRHRDLLSEHIVSVTPAELGDHALYGRGLPHPFVAPNPGSLVVGEVFSVLSNRWLRLLEILDEYEGPDYVRTSVLVETTAIAMEAQIYLASPHVELAPDQIVVSGDWFDVAP